MKVALVSLGCPKNLVDSEKMFAQLAQGQCVVGAAMDEADVVVVNTCGFLSSARDESLDVVREALRLKEAGQVQRVVVAGCLVNRDAGKLFDLVPGIDAIVGVNDRDDLLRAVTGKGKVACVTANPPRGAGRAYVAGLPIASDEGRFRLTPRHTAYLRISEGCSQRCTFCTIPAIRGPFRSKTPQQVLDEASELIQDGAVELNVIGQDTTSYGMDLRAHGTQSVGFHPDDLDSLEFDEDGACYPVAQNTNLARMMSVLSGLDGLRWLRLMYAYPIRFSNELIDTMAACDTIVPYVDLPLQHICDPVLRRMGRRVTRARIESLLGKMRRRIPNLAIRTTFIVGFPGETDAQFEELLGFVKDFRFDALGVFEYSPEEGTPSAKMTGQVPPKVKARRARQVMLAQQKIAFAANRRRVGQEVKVLVDGADHAGRCVGRHAGQAPDIDSVCLLTRPRRPGTFVTGKVIGSDNYDLIVD